jgi:hypothetical protein
MVDRAARRHENQTSLRVATPFLEGAPGIMTVDRYMIEIIHSGATELTIRTGKAGRSDDRRRDAKTGASPQYRAGILGDVGLVKRQAQMFGRGTHRYASKAKRKKGKAQRGVMPPQEPKSRVVERDDKPRLDPWPNL